MFDHLEADFARTAIAVNWIKPKTDAPTSETLKERKQARKTREKI
jgi:hypothetical protein